MFPKDTEQHQFNHICKILRTVIHEKRITVLFLSTIFTIIQHQLINNTEEQIFCISEFFRVCIIFLKFWSVTETHYIPQRQLSPVAGISNEYGYDRIYNWLEYARTELPYMCDILNDLPKPENPQQTVYVMHMPPAGLRLGQLLYQDLDIGSVDICEFLKERQPMLSLHGHIHESPDTQKGRWINQIRSTACIQTGQTELHDNDMVYAEIDLQSREYSRKVINVK